MAKNKQGGAPRTAGDFRRALLEEGVQAISGAAGENIIRLLRADQVQDLASKLPVSLLTDGDARIRAASVIGLALSFVLGWDTVKRDAAEAFLVQAFEEVGKIAPTLNPGNETATRASMRQAMSSKTSLLDPLKQKAAPKQPEASSDGRRPGMDYFQAKAAIKDAAVIAGLRRLEIILKADPNRPGDYALLMKDGAHNIRTTPEELTSIVNGAVDPAETEVALDQLVALMKGPRGMGATSVKAKSIVDKLLGATLHSGSVMGTNATDMGDQAEKWAGVSKTAREKRKYT